MKKREHTYADREIDEMFKDVTGGVKDLHDKLLDPEWGILPKVLEQTTKHNGRLTKLEKIMWVMGTAIVILGATGSPIIKLLFPSI